LGCPINGGSASGYFWSRSSTAPGITRKGQEIVAWLDNPDESTEE
jgi:hypothetical protein